jgi:hypothetical protein
MTKGVMRERHAPLTEEELDAVTVVFHQFETGLREGTIYTKVSITYIFRGKAHLKIRRQNSCPLLYTGAINLTDGRVH